MCLIFFVFSALSACFLFSISLCHIIQSQGFTIELWFGFTLFTTAACFSLLLLQDLTKIAPQIESHGVSSLIEHEDLEGVSEVAVDVRASGAEVEVVSSAVNSD